MWGVSKRNGEIIIPIHYEFIINDYDKKHTLVKRNNQFGVLNYNLKDLYLFSSNPINPQEIIPCQYDAMYDDSGRREDYYSNLSDLNSEQVSDEGFPVSQENYYNFLHLYFVKENDDNSITCHKYDNNEKLTGEFTCEKFCRDTIWVSGRCGILNSNGNIIVPCEYEEVDYIAGSHVYNISKIKKNNLWGIISKEKLS